MPKFISFILYHQFKNSTDSNLDSHVFKLQILLTEWGTYINTDEWNVWPCSHLAIWSKTRPKVPETMKTLTHPNRVKRLERLIDKSQGSRRLNMFINSTWCESSKLKIYREEKKCGKLTLPEPNFCSEKCLDFSEAIIFHNSSLFRTVRASWQESFLEWEYVLLYVYDLCKIDMSSWHRAATSHLQKHARWSDQVFYFVFALFTRIQLWSFSSPAAQRTRFSPLQMTYIQPLVPCLASQRLPKPTPLAHKPLNK